MASIYQNRHFSNLFFIKRFLTQKGRSQIPHLTRYQANSERDRDKKRDNAFITVIFCWYRHRCSNSWWRKDPMSEVNPFTAVKGIDRQKLPPLFCSSITIGTLVGCTRALRQVCIEPEMNLGLVNCWLNTVESFAVTAVYILLKFIL